MWGYWGVIDLPCKTPKPNLKLTILRSCPHSLLLIPHPRASRPAPLSWLASTPPTSPYSFPPLPSTLPPSQPTAVPTSPSSAIFYILRRHLVLFLLSSLYSFLPCARSTIAEWDRAPSITIPHAATSAVAATRAPLHHRRMPWDLRRQRRCHPRSRHHHVGARRHKHRAKSGLGEERRKVGRTKRASTG